MIRHIFIRKQGIKVSYPQVFVPDGCAEAIKIARVAQPCRKKIPAAVIRRAASPGLQ
jgi:hypothetical protein